jgi:Carboxypeptidase regulatory-like domain/TonB-dependent Receptor Plug Domain
MKSTLAFWAVILLTAIEPVYPQSGNSGTIRGTVLDASGAAIKGAAATIENPVSHYVRSVTTDDQGKFVFDNVPYNNYHLTVSAPNFAASTQELEVRAPVPVDVPTTLQISGGATTITVTAESSELVENIPVTHTDVDRAVLDRLPIQSQSSSLSAALTATVPGIAEDSDGLIHGLGDHASNSFSVDGEQITDQQSKVFSNQVPLDAVQSMEVIEGAPPAEYGDKTSLVIAVTTRSGLGTKPVRGEVTTSYGTFGTTNQTFNLAAGSNSLGNFVSANGLNTGRFLDGPEFAVIHSRGNEQNLFDRVDFKPTASDTLSLNLNFTRSWFQTPNSYDAQDATAWSGPLCLAFGYSTQCNGLGPNGQVVGSTDQRSKITTINISQTWTHILSPEVVLTFGGFIRQDQYHYYPSDNPYADLIPKLTLETVGQHRTLTDLGLRSNVAYAKGIHNLKAGITYSDTILTERDTVGIVSPSANAPCLNPDGSPNLNPLITSQTGCTGMLTPNPAFVPLLGCYDLTRLAPLPASDGCPTSTSGEYHFFGHANIREVALFAQDNITVGRFTFNLGLRFDYYDGIVTADQVQPRLGASYKLKPTGTILRISYARTLETPFNENLVLSSEGCADPVIAALQEVSGNPCVSTAPLRPGWRNEFHAGLEQAFGKYFVLDGEYIWKYTHRAYDFSVLGNTPLTFPIEWARSKIPGFALRGTMPTRHGLSAYIVMSSVAARFFEPQVAGIGATPTGSGVFRIDHDEIFNQTTHLQYQPWKRGPWLSFNWRYDSGLVAGAVPCAGGNCANGPNGSDTVVDVSNLTPDQQFQAGLFCGSVFATPLTSISPNNLCPASIYGSRYLSIPAPGTQNDDHNPARVSQRNLFDLAIGDDDLFHTDKYKWIGRITVVNLGNTIALYNFLSTFSGTHYVTARTITVTLGLRF